jgi:hypothetical protein
MRRRLVLLLSVLTGCDMLFGLDHVDRDAGTVVGDIPTPRIDAPVDSSGVDPRIIAHFDFNGTLIDSVSGTAATCVTGTGCPSFKVGVRGMGIQLDGGDDCLRFTLPTNPPQLTVAFWINKSTDAGASLVAKPVGAGGLNTFQIDSEPSRILRFITYNGLSTDILGLPSAFPLAAWAHIAGTFDGNKQVFVNGTEIGNSASMDQLVSDGAPLLIGCDRDNGVYTRFYMGAIDEVIVFNAVLNDAEISSLAAP